MEEASCAWTAGQLNRSWGRRADVFGAAYGDEGLVWRLYIPLGSLATAAFIPPKYLDHGPLENGQRAASLGAQRTRLGTIATCTEKETCSKSRDVYSLVKTHPPKMIWKGESKAWE